MLLASIEGKKLVKSLRLALVGFDIHAGLIARFMGAHIPGNPVLVPQNMVGAGFRRSSVRAPPSLRHAKSDILILIVATFSS